MSTQPLSSPFGDEPIDRFHLRVDPIVRVLSQVRHPSLAVLMGDDGKQTALRFAQKVASRYPIFDEVREAEFTLTPQGVVERPSSSMTWRLRSADEQWAVSVNPQFVSLETSAYSGRDDFCERLQELLAAYSETVTPPTALRLGLRYTNRIDDAATLARLSDFFRREVLGPVAMRDMGNGRQEHAFTQSQYTINDAGLTVNCGLLPPNAIVDPTIPPVDKASWILDMDAFSVGRLEFDPSLLTSATRDLARRIYRYFRWSVTEEFLMEFGEEM